MADIDPAFLACRMMNCAVDVVAHERMCVVSDIDMPPGALADKFEQCGYEIVPCRFIIRGRHEEPAVAGQGHHFASTGRT
jgi:hypothetical protein